MEDDLIKAFTECNGRPPQEHELNEMFKRHNKEIEKNNIKYKKQAETHEKAKLRYKGRYIKQRQARVKVQNAIESGKLTKPIKCNRCPNTGRLEAHHHDYEKPLNVEWLCVCCHKLEHRKINNTIKSS